MEEARIRTQRTIQLISLLRQCPIQEFFRDSLNHIKFPNSQQFQIRNQHIQNLVSKIQEMKQNYLIVRDPRERDISKMEMNQFEDLKRYYILEKQYFERMQQLCEEQRSNYFNVARLSLERDLQIYGTNSVSEEQQLKKINELLEAVVSSILMDVKGNYDISMVKLDLLQNRERIEKKYGVSIKGEWIVFDSNPKLPWKDLLLQIQTSHSNQVISTKLKKLLELKIFSFSEYNTFKNLLDKDMKLFFEKLTPFFYEKELSFQFSEVQNDRNRRKEYLDFYLQLYQSGELLNRVRQIYYQQLVNGNFSVETFLADYRNGIEIMDYCEQVDKKVV